MVKQQPPRELSDTDAGPTHKSRRIRVAATWLGYYVIALVLVLLTNPVTSKSDTWSGIGLAYIVIMFGASRLASLGVTASATFVYGCGSSLLLLERVLFLSRIELWGTDEPPSNAVTIAWSSFVCIILGLLAVTVRFCVHSQKASAEAYSGTEAS
jgi:hypothetical protein